VTLRTQGDAAAPSADTAAGQASDWAIAVEGLHHRYAGMSVDALGGVDFHVPHGALAGLIGPNGAGKSTLLALLNGVLRLQRGSVRVAGQRPADGRCSASVSSLVPQGCAFYGELTGRENLAFLAGIHSLSRSVARDRIAEAVEVTGLADVLDRKAGQYSGGLQRRLNLALGWINRPTILYLDEPTVGVDAVSRQAIIDAIDRLRTRGTTIVYTSHYMEEVEHLCDRLTVIDRGRAVASGPTEELLERLGGTWMEVVAAPTSAAGLGDILSAWAPAWFDERCVRLRANGTADVSAIMRRLDECGVAVERVQFGVERLADVYWRLVHQGAEEGEPA